LAGFVVEAGFGYGKDVFRGELPAADPDRFYRTYIKGPTLRTLLRACPERIFPRVEAVLVKLMEGVGK
jgi:hypothetical protein